MRKLAVLAVLFVASAALLAQQGLTNDAIVKMEKAGLSDDIIVATINAQPGKFDTTTNGLIALKSAGVSDKVVAAMITRASGAMMPTAVAAAAPGLPAGIDDVGVYFKDKSGNWSALLPEIVNFKTGGVMKSMFTDGIVKGDLNGHVDGPHAKESLNFPVVLAVYVPEGTAITEYQLLRLRGNDKSREFRSVTGGVFHTSGGATRDVVPFKSEKIGPRLYQVTLDNSLGKGEYGLLPPGAVGTSNLGSSGKLYTVSIPE